MLTVYAVRMDSCRVNIYHMLNLNCARFLEASIKSAAAAEDT